MPSPVIKTTTSALRGLQSLCAQALGVAFSPVPMLTSADADGTLFLAPLAYLAATLLTALYFGQLWLLALSAFGVVWIDTQMAWRAQQIGKAKMERYMREQLQNHPSATAVQHAAEPPESATHLPEAEPDAGPEDEDADEAEVKVEVEAQEEEERPSHSPKLQPRRRGELENEAEDEEEAWEDEEEEVDAAAPRPPRDAELTVLRSHIATATLCGMPAPATQALLTPQQAQRLQADMDMALVLLPDQQHHHQHQQQQEEQEEQGQHHHSRHEQLQTVLEEEAISAADDCSFTLMHEMEAVKQELARVLSQRAERVERCLPPSPPSSVPGDEEEEEEEAPLALPPAAAAAAAAAGVAATTTTTAAQLPEEELEEAPALPEDDDLSITITSMEQLDEPVSSAASLNSFGDFMEPVVGAGQDFSRPPSTAPPAAAAAAVGPGKKEQPHFPIIDDVLCEYEASRVQPQSQPATAPAQKPPSMLYDHDREEEEATASSSSSSSSDDSRHDSGSSGDESGCQSPASSVSSVCSSHGDDDVEMHPLDRAPKPAFRLGAAVVSQTEVPPVVCEATLVACETEAPTLPVDAAPTVLDEPEPAAAVSVDKQDNEPMELPVQVVATKRRQPVHAKRAPRKNNGWKRVPIKARLSPSQKRGLLSRSPW